MLSFFVWVPFLGVLLISLLPPSWVDRSRQIALVLCGLIVIWSLYLISQFRLEEAGLQFQESLPWIANLGLSYQLGLDGLSLPLLVMNGVLTWIALYASDPQINRPKLFYSLVLLLNGAVSGAFLAQNLLLFFLFYEVELIPLYLVIAIWGGSRRGYAATKFLIYTAVSGVVILAAFFGLSLLSESGSFDYAIVQTQDLSLTVQVALLVTLLVGFGIKVPIVPLHTWLPDAHVEAPTPASVLLAGVLLKLGTYGMLRFGLGLFPDAWEVLSPWIAAVAVISVLYGSFAAIAQTDMKKIVAYSSVGHMGYVILAAAAATPLSLMGAIAQMVSHGLISALLFLLVGVVYAKTGTRDINILRGLLNPERGLPVVGSLMIVGAMASAGIPGMVGFIAEFIVYRGSLPVFPVQTLLCMVGTGLTAVYFLILINKVFFGRLPETLANLPPVRWRDRIPSVAVAGLVILLGLQPAWMTRWSVEIVKVLGIDSPSRTAMNWAVPTMPAEMTAETAPLTLPFSQEASEGSTLIAPVLDSASTGGLSAS